MRLATEPAPEPTQSESLLMGWMAEFRNRLSHDAAAALRIVARWHLQVCHGFV